MPKVEFLFRKDFWIVVLIGYLLRSLWHCYLILSYKKMLKCFIMCDHDKSLALAQKLQRQMYPSAFPNKKRFLPFYNNVCQILASLALLNQDDTQFLLQLDKVQEKDTYPLKSFTLALYFRSKGQFETAKVQYTEFLSCSGIESHMRTVMDFLFAAEESTVGEDILQHAVKQFKNPAIILLLERNGLTVC